MESAYFGNGARSAMVEPDSSMVAGTSMPAHPAPGLVLRRGWSRRCPRCGEGALFLRGIEIHKRCARCNLLFQRDQGDTWMFMIITDRIPILFGIALVYFGFRSTSWITGTAFFIAMAVPMIATIRQRQGLALALDYLSRIYWRDPSDEIHGGGYVGRSSEDFRK